MAMGSQGACKSDGLHQGPDAAPAVRATTAGRSDDVASNRTTVVLASASPRRKMLLENAGVSFSIRVADVDETLEPDLAANPPEAAKKLAERKAKAVVQMLLDEGLQGFFVVIGADTMVVKDSQIFGKPVNRADAERMLRELSAVTHQVMTGVSVWMVFVSEDDDVSLGFRTFVEESLVTFRDLSDDDISAYLDTGESFDKAGAYAVQGEGAVLVSNVVGDLDNVIGLPVKRLIRDFPELVNLSC